ncbi:phage shock protein A [Paenibacillus chitinolyticus]|uniref:PspA/IM30 family protein n=1 Tax=Paenibacillus chitinolyticus TaxID=79263 RepID=UPI0026E49776|nr:PspA/IM30 family protein [Paenibacillus chitinolyticus]GKS09152.1 phage shock protein A [Paenibacillus chitinolyticus]
MGILSRFRDIMTSNISALLEKSEDLEKMIDNFMHSLNSDLGQVKAETASVLAEERRVKRALDDCKAEIRKLQNYAEKAVEAGDDGDAMKFLEKKAPLAEKESQLQASYDLASSNVASMKQIQDKLESDIRQLEARRVNLKGKMAAAKAQQRLNAIGSPTGGGIDAIFDTMEEKVNRAHDEAMAIAELRSEKKDNLDDLFEQYEKNTNTSTNTNTEDELAAIKERIKKKQ